MEKKEIGKVSHYFGGPSVAALVLSDMLRVGDKISIEGHTTNFETVVASIQIEHTSVPEAKAGESVGIKVPERVREGDVVYKVIG